MERSLKDRWIKALRSGQYTQVYGVGRKELGGGAWGYCALGLLVLCEYGEFPKDSPAVTLRLQSHIPVSLLNAVVQWNDKDKLTFSEIADCIEKGGE